MIHVTYQYQGHQKWTPPPPPVNATGEHLTEWSGGKKEDYVDDSHDPATTEENLYNIQTYVNHNFPSPTMNPGVIDMCHNDPDTYIYNLD